MLVDALLPVDVNAGRPVRLNCDDAAVAVAGASLGIAAVDAVADLVMCLRDARLASAELGVAPLADAQSGNPPGYLLGLAVLVLAASRMVHDERASMAAYYRRLAELLQIPLQDSWPQVRGVPELVGRFVDLGKWMIEDERCRRGVLDLPVNARPSVVGVPIHQSLLREGDRASLGGFFERVSRLIAADWDPVHQLGRWGGRHQLSAPLQALLGTPALHPALAGALRAAWRSWDGSILDDAGHRLLPAALALHLPPGPFTLSATVPALSSRLDVSGPGDTTVALASEVSAAIPVDWLVGAEHGPLVVGGGDTRVRLFPGPTLLFEITALGIQGVASATEDAVWVLTCDRDLIAACDGHQRFAATLPTGWALLCDVEPEQLVDDLRAERREDHALVGVGTAGGLRLGEEVWLLGHPPDITIDLPDGASVSIDGRLQRDAAPEEVLSLAAIAGDLGLHHVDVGEQRITVEIAARGPREGVGDLAFDADAKQILGGPSPTDQLVGTVIRGPQVSPSPERAPASLIVRYRSMVDVIDADGSARRLAPPPPAAWLEHVGLPQEGPWEIPDGDSVVWLCADIPGRQIVVARRAIDVPPTDDVLQVVDWYAGATRIVDRSGGGASARWGRLVSALEAVS